MKNKTDYSIKDEFVPYKLALEMKELGFDWPCFGWHDWMGKKLYLTNNSYLDIDPTPAPTFSQCLRWFREKHKLHSSTFWMEIDKSIYWNYRYSYLNDKSTESVNRSMVYFNTPEEAELECLVKLIEICKK